MKSPALRLAVAALLLSGLPSTVVADGYWYLGLGAGLGWAQLYSADFNPGSSCVGCTDSKEEFDAGFKGFIGYQFSRSWAFEASYASLGKYHYKVSAPSGTDDFIFQVKGAAYSFVPTIPLGRSLSLFGRLGAFDSQTRATRHTNGSAVGVGAQSNKFTPLTGFGVQYFFNEESGIRFEFENFGKVGTAVDSTCSAGVGVSTSCTGRANLKMVSASLLFPF